MRKNTNKALWFFLTTLISIFSICTIRIFDGFNWPFYAVALNALVSLGGLVFQLHADERVQKKPLFKVARVLMLLDSIFVFVMLAFSLFILTSQYHNPLTPDAPLAATAELDSLLEAADQDVLLCETDDLYVYAIDYDDIEFVTEQRPSKSDESILLCVAAAFQGDYELSFSHDNVVGWHASNGHLERGKPQANLGAFTWVDSVARIWDVDEAEEAVQGAAARGGTGYQQFVVLADGQRGSHGTNEFRCFRVLALLDDRVCVIDSRTQMHYDAFIEALERLGVRDALYCDMGSGWNYSWYRGKDGNTVDIIGKPWPFSHNWLVFKKAM